MKKTLTLLVLFISFSLTANNELTIAWDTSLSMKNRDLAKEFDLLESYFSKYPEATVTILEFNNIRILENKVKVTNGNWQEIKTQLSTSIYDGATSYEKLPAKLGEDIVLIFTDGVETLIRDTKILGKKPYIINSNADLDIDNLKFLALSNKGRLINLKFLENAANMPDQEITYMGNIFSPLVPLEDIRISVKGSSTEATPRRDGTYSIQAKPGEVILVSAGDQTLTEKTLNENRILNLWVTDKIEQLDAAQVLQNEEFRESEKEIQTGLRKTNKRSLGFSVASADESDISGYRELADAIRGRYAGVLVDRDLGNIQLTRFATFNGNRNALVILDGAPLADGVNIEGIVTPQNVASIDILKGFAATNIYGSDGRNGVVLITTKATASAMNATAKKKAPKNLYTGPVLSEDKIKDPAYLSNLKQQRTLATLYDTYLNERENYWDQSLYLADVSEYFSNWNEILAEQIAYNVLERDSDLSTLRGLLFTAYKTGNPNLALDIAYATLEKYPQQTQSYLDLAMAHKAAGNYQEALNRLLAIEYGTANQSLDFSNLRSIVDNEIRNLVQEQKPNLKLGKIQVKHLKKKDLNSRIVIDWSNRDAEFELTFISPDNLYTKWSHTLANNELMEEEVLHGFSQKEFEIDGGVQGEWTVNVKYLGNKITANNDPSLLKCTIYHNYGSENERTEEKIIRLQEKGSDKLMVKLVTE